MYQSTRCHQTRKIFENPLWEDVFKKPAQVLFDGMNNYTAHFDERNQSTALIEVCERSSVRLSYSKDPATGELKILEENHYYPFGLRHEIYGNGSKMDYKKSAAPHNGTVITYATQIPYQYKFGGKEFQDELGLNWYSYGFRMYVPALGRFPSVDPMAENYPSMSPYAYAANNPLFYIDPDGREIIPYLYKNTDNRGRPLRTKYRSNTNYIKAMKDFGKTTYGKELISAFTEKGKSHYGVKGNGKYADYNLEIRQIDFENGTEQFAYLGPAEGYFTPKEIDGKLTIIMALDVKGDSKYIAETIVHELAVHGYKIEEIIKAYEKGGMDAVNQVMKGKEAIDHSELINENTNHEGVLKYNQTRDELINLNPEYKKVFENEKKKYKKHYSE